jgi:hypothetical protein
MGVSGQRHAPAALLSAGKGPPVPIVQEAGWAPEPVWTQRIEKKILCPHRGSNPDRSVVQPVVRHYTAWATPAPEPLYLRGIKCDAVDIVQVLFQSLFCFIIIWLYRPIWALASPFGVSIITFLRGWLVSPAPNPQPGGTGLRIYDPRRHGGPAIPQALDNHFSRLLRHAWVTVGLFFNPGHHTGILLDEAVIYEVQTCFLACTAV